VPILGFFIARRVFLNPFGEAPAATPPMFGVEGMRRTDNERRHAPSLPALALGRLCSRGDPAGNVSVECLLPAKVRVVHQAQERNATCVPISMLSPALTSRKFIRDAFLDSQSLPLVIPSGYIRRRCHGSSIPRFMSNLPRNAATRPPAFGTHSHAFTD